MWHINTHLMQCYWERNLESQVHIIEKKKTENQLFKLPSQETRNRTNLT